MTDPLQSYDVELLSKYNAELQEIESLPSGGDKRPRTVTGKVFRAIDQPQKFLLIDKIIS